jgi:hypothetical protein
MKNKQLGRGGVVVAVLIVGAAASADPVDDLNLAVGDWADRSDRLASNPRTFAAIPPEKCFAVLDAAKQGGIPGSQILRGYRFKSHPKAREDANGNYEITVDEARAYCVTYQRHYPFAAEWATFDHAEGVRNANSYNTSISKDQEDSAHEIAAGCRAAAKRAAQAGVPSDLPTTIKVAPTFGDIPTKLCDALEKGAEDLAKGLSESTKAIREKYEAAGITGDKLALMVKYDSVYWRLPGGGRTDDPKKLAAATVLYQWLEAEDRDDARYVVHTIRKYKFKGGSIIGPTEKTYRRKKGANVDKLFK